MQRRQPCSSRPTPRRHPMFAAGAPMRTVVQFLSSVHVSSLDPLCCYNTPAARSLPLEMGGQSVNNPKIIGPKMSKIIEK